jgi:hypothetical protein
MAYFASTFSVLTGAKGCFSGILAWINENWSGGIRIHLPPNCSTVENPPSGDSYVNRQYLVGGHTRNLVIDEMFRASVQGIPPPPSPTVSSGAGAIAQIGYLRYYDGITGERSTLSSGLVFTGDVTRAWTSLPTSPGEVIVLDGVATISSGTVTGTGTNFHDLRPGDRIAVSTTLTRWAQVEVVTSSTSMTIDDAAMSGTGVALVVKPVQRISHVELWVSVGGALPRFILRVRIGTTAVTESVATLALGEAFTDNYEPMPHGTYNVIYNSRQIMAGVAGRLDRVFISLVGYPERYGGLNFQVKYGETIVGLVRTRDYVVVLCPKSSYRLQGFTEDDFTLSVLEPEIGGLSHGANAVCGGQIFIPSREQIQTFDGAFHDAMPTRRSEWVRNVRASPDAYQGGVGMVDPGSQTYRFMPFQPRLTAEVTSDLPAPPVAPTSGCPDVWLDGIEQILGERLYFLQYVSAGICGYFYFSDDQIPVLCLQTYPTGVEDYDAIIFASGDGGAFILGYDNTNYLLREFARRELPTLLASTAKAVPGVGAEGLAGIVYQGEPYIFVDLETSPAIYKYTGGALVAETIPAVAPPAIPHMGFPAMTEFFVVGDDLYHVSALIDPTTNPADPIYTYYKIYRKSGGTWTAFGLPEFSGVNLIVAGAVSYDGALYIFGAGGGMFDWVVLKVVGSTVTLELVSTGMQLSSPCVFNGYLYYIADPGASYPNQPYLGRFDGTTWDDTHLALSSFIPGMVGYGWDGPKGTVFLGAMGDSLRLIIFDEHPTSPCEFNIYSSPGINTAGTWVCHAARHMGLTSHDYGGPSFPGAMGIVS